MTTTERETREDELLRIIGRLTGMPPEKLGEWYLEDDGTIFHVQYDSGGKRVIERYTGKDDPQITQEIKITAPSLLALIENGDGDRDRAVEAVTKILHNSYQ